MPGMDCLFYHLTESRVEQALPKLVEMCLDRSWRVLIQCGDDATLELLDEALWTYRDESFLPHGVAGSAPGTARDHPVWLDSSADQSTGRDVHFAVAGAVPDDTRVAQRIIYMFDGHDADAVASARKRWTVEKEAGRDLTYWQQSGGRWEKKAG